MKSNFLNYKLIIFCVLFLNIGLHHIKAQSNDTEMALYNIGFGSVFSGVGAIINKKPDEKWHKVLFKGMAQGAAGGYLIFESKRLLRKIETEESWEYSWYAKLVNSSGTSIIENAASNRNFYDKWHLNIGFNRLELDTREKIKLDYKLMPISFLMTAYSAFNWDFELQRTFQTGEIIFSGNIIDNDNANGLALGNIVVIDNSNLDDYSVFSHEFIHVYQYYDFNVFNTYLNQPFTQFNFKSKTFNELSKYLYYDLQVAILRPLYLLENNNRDCFYDNFFENEAGYFSNSIFCD